MLMNCKLFVEEFFFISFEAATFVVYRHCLILSESVFGLYQISRPQLYQMMSIWEQLGNFVQRWLSVWFSV